MANKLKAITTKAKALYKSGKYKKWTDAIKAASKTIGATKKPAAKKTATKKGSYHKDTKSHNVNIRVISGITLSDEEKKFIESESKKSKGYKYRGKILFGSPIVLKETKNGTPVQKYYVDNLEKANYISSELNKNKSYAKIKGKKIS